MDIPHKPGIYIFKDKEGEVIYVGKAIDLKVRVSSYFAARTALRVKTAALREKIKTIETRVVESELEALILEASLIKKYLPAFNVRLTDDKDYLYAGITKEDFPKLLTARKKDLPGFKKYFGPFPSAKTTRNTLRVLRKVFPWCQIKSSTLKVQSPPAGRAGEKFKPCFYYHLGLCPGACAGRISKEDYQNIISRFIKFMEGEKNKLLDELDKEMKNYAENMQFEEAQKVKKTINGINYLTSPTNVAQYLENPNCLEDQRNKALVMLKDDLQLKETPKRIEAYDISNIQGKEAAGSMVVLTSGEIDKSQYRRFKIKISGRPNDVGMHKEMIARRLKHKEWPLPNLILVDGGRGQARGVKFEILNFKLKIPVFGLAKRMEWLYPPEGEIIKLPKSSLSLRLLQKIRDQSHRFALSYHRKLRSKSFFS